jgi:cytochrome b
LIRVWDLAVRTLHWALVASVALAWLTTTAAGHWHQPVGYVALALVFVRTFWGAAGSRYARFSQFVRGPRATWRYAGRVMQRREPRHLGHNPLGAYMALALMACIAALALTGWLYTTDRFWGDATVEAMHRMLAWLLVVLAALHLGGVMWMSRRHDENLVRAMIDGRKRRPCDDDIA